jgi:hypothetical protein
VVLVEAAMVQLTLLRYLALQTLAAVAVVVVTKYRQQLIMQGAQAVAA